MSFSEHISTLHFKKIYAASVKNKFTPEEVENAFSSLSNIDKLGPVFSHFTKLLFGSGIPPYNESEYKSIASHIGALSSSKKEGSPEQSDEIINKREDTRARLIKALDGPSINGVKAFDDELAMDISSKIISTMENSDATKSFGDSPVMIKAVTQLYYPIFFTFKQLHKKGINFQDYKDEIYDIWAEMDLVSLLNGIEEKNETTITQKSNSLAQQIVGKLQSGEIDQDPISDILLKEGMPKSYIKNLSELIEGTAEETGLDGADLSAASKALIFVMVDSFKAQVAMGKSAKEAVEHIISGWKNFNFKDIASWAASKKDESPSNIRESKEIKGVTTRFTGTLFGRTSASSNKILKTAAENDNEYWDAFKHYYFLALINQGSRNRSNGEATSTFYKLLSSTSGINPKEIINALGTYPKAIIDNFREIDVNSLSGTQQAEHRELAQVGPTNIQSAISHVMIDELERGTAVENVLSENVRQSLMQSSYWEAIDDIKRERYEWFPEAEVDLAVDRMDILVNAFKNFINNDNNYEKIDTKHKALHNRSITEEELSTFFKIVFRLMIFGSAINGFIINADETEASDVIGILKEHLRENFPFYSFIPSLKFIEKIGREFSGSISGEQWVHMYNGFRDGLVRNIIAASQSVKSAPMYEEIASNIEDPSVFARYFGNLINEGTIMAANSFIEDVRHANRIDVKGAVHYLLNGCAVFGTNDQYNPGKNVYDYVREDDDKEFESDSVGADLGDSKKDSREFPEAPMSIWLMPSTITIGLSILQMLEVQKESRGRSRIGF